MSSDFNGHVNTYIYHIYTQNVFMGCFMACRSRSTSCVLKKLVFDSLSDLMRSKEKVDCIAFDLIAYDYFISYRVTVYFLVVYVR